MSYCMYHKCSKFCTPKSDKMAYANKRDQDQIAPEGAV